MLEGEKPIDASDRIYELYLILRRRSQELPSQLPLRAVPDPAPGLPATIFGSPVFRFPPRENPGKT